MGEGSMDRFPGLQFLKNGHAKLVSAKGRCCRDRRLSSWRAGWSYRLLHEHVVGIRLLSIGHNLRFILPQSRASDAGLPPLKYRLAFAACLAIIRALPAVGEERPADPEAFVRDLYKYYGEENRPDPLGQVAPKLFMPRLLDLIRADERVPSGDIGRLDEDPLCDCQDDGGFRLSSIMIDRLSADQATATVRMIVGVVPIVIVLDLVQSDSRWRIADVHSRSIPSLVAFLSSIGSSR